MFRRMYTQENSTSGQNPSSAQTALKLNQRMYAPVQIFALARAPSLLFVSLTDSTSVIYSSTAIVDYSNKRNETRT